MSDEPAWESWLRENFAAYLMRAARGEARPEEAVARALARLSGSPGALTRLASLGFLLDPTLTTLVCDDLPRFLDHVTPTTRRDEHESRGFARGRIAWARTIARRQQTRDPLVFITSVARRSFHSPELLVLRWLLDRVLTGIDSVRGLAGVDTLHARTDRWPDRLAALHRAAHEAMRHVTVRDLPATPPGPDARRVAANSRHEFVRATSRALALHDELLPVPRGPALARVLAAHALSPNDGPRRFELYFLMSLADAVGRVWPDATRHDSLIDPKRKEVIVWSVPGWTLGLRYDHKSPAGHYSRTLLHAFNLKGFLRPDLWLTLHGPGTKAELYLDAKLSVDDHYLKISAQKMLASLIDRAGSFLSPGPCGVLLSLRSIDHAPDLDTPLAFLDPSACTAGAALDRLIETWLTRAGAPV